MQTLIPASDKHRTEALVASGRVRLLRFAAALAELVGDRLRGPWKSWLRAQIAHAERYVDLLIFLMACAHIVTPALRGPERPLSFQAGFRLRATRGSLLRRLSHGAFPRSRAEAPSVRVRRMLDVLADPSACVARMIKRLRRRFVRARLVAIAPPAATFASGAPTCAVAHADTS